MNSFIAIRSKSERAQLEKNDQRLQQVRENIDEEANKWIQLAGELSHDELVKRIQDELLKTDGSAEIAVEVFMNPALQEILGQGGLANLENASFEK